MTETFLEEIERLRADLAHAVECNHESLKQDKFRHYPIQTVVACPECQRIGKDLKP